MSSAMMSRILGLGEVCSVQAHKLHMAIIKMDVCTLADLKKWIRFIVPGLKFVVPEPPDLLEVLANSAIR